MVNSSQNLKRMFVILSIVKNLKIIYNFAQILCRNKTARMSIRQVYDVNSASSPASI